MLETECLNPREFNHFLRYVEEITERLGDFLFVIHTTGVGDVYWRYADGLWCVVKTVGA